MKLSILSLLNGGDMYGYELIREMKTKTEGCISYNESNTYPALHSVEEEGLVTCYMKTNREGLPPRKYYQITEKGNRILRNMLHEWRKYVIAIDGILDIKNEKRP
ncbi:PadR family transcriptional regulator [Methanooceanicella nereidis]|nr:PadR family transcriptional regulator [Methanocella sp. CWC-04]